MWYTHITEYYLGIKKNEVLMKYTTMRIKLKYMLSERQMQIVWSHIVWSHLYEIFRIGKVIETVSRLVVARGWRREHGECWVWGFPWGDENDLALDRGGNCPTL